jgi:hypothetical protein
MADKKKKQAKAVTYGSAKQKAVTHSSGFASTTIKLPKDMEFFSPKKPGTYELDLIPYMVEKGSDKKGGNPNCASGLMYYERTFYVHWGIGVENKSYVCLAKTFGKKCPCCERLLEMKKDKHADEDEIKRLYPRERQVFYVNDHSDPKKGVQVWDMSYPLFGSKLDEELAATDDGDADLDFYHLDGGSTLRVTFKEKTFPGGSCLEAKVIKFKLRDESLDEEVLELPPLDSLLIELDYDKLKAIDDGDEADAGEGEEEEKPKGGKKATAKPPADEEDEEESDEDEDTEEDEEEEEEKPAPKKGGGKKPPTAKDKGLKKGDTVTYEDMECEITKISPDGTSLTLEDEDGDEHKAVGVDEVEKAEEEKPASKKPEPKKGGGKKTQPEPEEEENEEDEDEEELDLDMDEDEEEEEEPVKKPAPKKKK